MVGLAKVLAKDTVLANRWYVAKAKARVWLRSLAKNGFDHSESIERYLDRLIVDNVKKNMSPAEVFVLLYATYLHDIGKTVNEKGHELLSRNKILKEHEKFGLNNFEAIAVAEVAYAHADEKEKPIKSLDCECGIDSLSRDRVLDLQFLGALLRMLMKSITHLQEQSDSGQEKIRSTSHQVY